MWRDLRWNIHYQRDVLAYSKLVFYMVDFRNNDCNVFNVMMWQKNKYAGDAGVDGS